MMGYIHAFLPTWVIKETKVIYLKIKENSQFLQTGSHPVKLTDEVTRSNRDRGVSKSHGFRFTDIFHVPGDSLNCVMEFNHFIVSETPLAEYFIFIYFIYLFQVSLLFSQLFSLKFCVKK